MNLDLRAGARESTQALATEYSSKAAAYARYWAPVIRPMALPLLPALPLRSARTVLDIGTGTGTWLPDLQKAAPGAAVIGLDRAEGMLRVAQRSGGTSLAVTDGQYLAIRTAAVDVVLLVFILFHFPEPQQALREVCRVLRRNGAAGIVSWGEDPGLPGQSVWKEELDREGAASDPRDPRVMQQAQMDTLDRIRQLVAAAGLSVVKAWSLTAVHGWNLEDLLAEQAGCGMPARRLGSLSPPARVRCASRVKARLEKLSREELIYRPEVLFCVASRRAQRGRRALRF